MAPPAPGNGVLPPDDKGIVFYDKAKYNAGWRDKPGFGCIATEDKRINPDIQRAMYKRSNTKTVDVKGSHVIFMSQPEAVAKMIEEAANVKVQ